MDILSPLTRLSWFSPALRIGSAGPRGVGCAIAASGEPRPECGARNVDREAETLNTGFAVLYGASTR